MLELLSQILGFIWDFIPRPSLVGPTEEAVCYWLGKLKYKRKKGPGLYLIWPLIMEWRTYQIVSQICETAIVPVSDEDGVSWQIRLAIEFEVEDVFKFNENQYDAQVHLEQLGSSQLVSIISGMTTQKILDVGVNKICNLIYRRLQERMKDRGVSVTRIRPIMWDRCISLFHSQSQKLSD